MGGVDIAADDDAPALLPLRLGVLQDGLLELELVGNPTEVVTAVREVAGIEEEVTVVGDDQSSLVVEAGLVESAQERQ